MQLLIVVIAVVLCVLGAAFAGMYFLDRSVSGGDR